MNKNVLRKKNEQFFDEVYSDNGRLWGNRPSELCHAACTYLQDNGSSNDAISILDIGCGYGRDTFAFKEHLNCNVLAIDPSERAILMAREAVYRDNIIDVEFRCQSFTELKSQTYDIVFISNLYHILHKRERKTLREVIRERLKPEGLLFLSCHSIKDPAHYGKGIPVLGEQHSFEDGIYRHFSTSEELIDDFLFLNIIHLYEHEYIEPLLSGQNHHHVSWIFIGQHLGVKS